MMIDDTVRLAFVYMYCWEKFLVDQFGPSLPNQSWYGQVISLKPGLINQLSASVALI